MGIAFGLGIWASSYRGWIRAMNILPAEQLPGRRGTLVMIAAHAVHGATLGGSAEERNDDGLGPRHLRIEARLDGSRGLTCGG